VLRRLSRGEGLRPSPKEIDLAAFSKRFDTPPQTILEIGANDGSDSERLLSTFDAATLHCFEPDPRALALLRQRITSERARIYPIAVSDFDGVLPFHQSGGAPPGKEQEYPEGWHRSSSLQKPAHHVEEFPWCTFDTTIEVETVRLDTWRERHAIGKIDFIWADIQGAEPELLRGGQETLRNTRFLYTEFVEIGLYEGHLPLDELLAMIPDWKVVTRFPNDILLENRAFRSA
jgi:FkbM family methyltransferase